MVEWLINLFARPVPVQVSSLDDPGELADTSRQTMVCKRRILKVADSVAARIGSSCWPAQVEDVYSTGIEVEVGIWKQQGETISIKLHNQRTNYSLRTESVIVQTVKRNDSKWLLICSFTKPLTRSEMDRLCL